MAGQRKRGPRGGQQGGRNAGLPPAGAAVPLLDSLSGLHAQLAEAMRREWRRDLPLNELLTDRWRRAKRAGFGSRSSVYDSCCMFGDVTVGHDTWIGPYTLLDGSGGLKIGSFCSISSGVMIFTHDTVLWALSGGRSKAELARVVIGDRCYIGSQAVIAKGVRIGRQCVIGANAFVNRNLPPRSIAVGSPARVVGRVECPRGQPPRLVFFARSSR